MVSSSARTPITWILIADAREAQIYVSKREEKRLPMAGNGKHHHMEEAHEWKLSPILAKPLSGESLKDYEIGRNKTGMVFESASSARHMAEPHLDARTEIRQHFAQRIASMLNGAKMGRAFDRLVLVASPRMLGEIDSKLDKKIRRKVTAKLAKELTHYNDRVLLAHIKDYL